jgi:LmbE family N-acetylglucosaminyl deacetylase
MDSKIIDSYQEIFKDKKRILVVFAHPDDLELYCGGTVARLIKDGKEIRSVKVTNGQNGSRQEKISSQELGVIRESEDRKAMEVLGISEENNIYLHLQDGDVNTSKETIGKLVYQIRIFKPDLIITHNPEDMVIRFDKNVNWFNHKDHRNTGISTIDASYPYSRDILFYPEQFSDPKISSHTVTEFLLVDYYDHPDLVHIDMTDFVDLRIKAHASHSSQYSQDQARGSADFFTKLPHYPEGKRFERFRYVLAD